MRAYSLKKVKEMVSLYNETKSSDKVAAALKLPRRDVTQIMVWLHKHDPINAHSARDGEFTLALPTNRVWVQWLYQHDVPAHTAAACLNWPLERLMETCGGPEEWAKHFERKPIELHENKIWNGKETQGRMPDDPTEEEIEARKREVHAMWASGDGSTRGGEPKDPRRLEVPQYVYDSRTGIFT